MRIAVVTPAVDRRGGTEKCMSWLVEDLSRRAELTIFTSIIHDTDVSRCRVHRVPVPRAPRVVRYVSFLAASTIMVRRQRRDFDVVLATAGDCLVSDVVYAHFCCAAWYRALRGGQVRWGGSTIRQRLRRLQHRAFMRVARRVERRIYRSRRLRAVAPVSAGTCREISEHYHVRPEKMWVIPNAVDDRVTRIVDERDRHRARLRHELGLRDEHVCLLFVAAGDWRRKRLGLLLEAVARLGAAHCRLLVVGDDDLTFHRAHADLLGIGEQIMFCGFRPDVERFYVAADVFVYPSTYEAFSLVTLEAAGAGLPLVVTSTNGTEELVHDGENGFVVPPEAPAIAEALRRLVEDPTLRALMGAAALAASRRFTREAVAESMLALCSAAESATSASSARGERAHRCG